MAATDSTSALEGCTNDLPSLRLCTFCNNATNGFEKWLFTKPQEKGPFFPILSVIRGDCTQYDDVGRALVCVACFHHLLRQWSSFERRCIPLQKREYLLIPEERVSSFQLRKEEEIRRDAERKLKEIQVREEKIKREADIRLALYKQREQLIKEEAEKRILEEQRELEDIGRQAAEKIKQEQEKEELLKRSLEEQIEEEKQKGVYIRKEAERLLREEKLLRERSSGSYSTQVLIQSPEGKVYDQLDLNANDPYLDANMVSRQRTMEYDPESGCYRRIVPLDFEEKKMEDIVASKIREGSTSGSGGNAEAAWRRPEEEEIGSAPDQPLVDVSFAAKNSTTSRQPIYVSSGLIKTEYKFNVAEDKTEPAKDGKDKSKMDEFEDADIEKAGEASKAKFREDRMKFQRDDSNGIVFNEVAKNSFEPRRSGSREDVLAANNADEKRARSMSLEKRLKDMEERRARLFRRASSGVENKENIEENVTECAPTSPDLTVVEDKEGSLTKEEGRKKARSRGERNKRRLTAEEMSVSKKHSESEDDNLSKKSDETKGMADKDLLDLTSTTADARPKTVVQEPSSMGSWWSSDYGAEEITFSVKETSKNDYTANNNDPPMADDAEDEHIKPQAEPATQSEPSVVDEVEIKTEKPNYDSRYSTNNELDDIVFSVKRPEKTQVNKVEIENDAEQELKKQPVPIPRKRSLKREVNVPDKETEPNLIQWEMKNVEQEQAERKSKMVEPGDEPRVPVSGDAPEDGSKRKPTGSDVTPGEVKRRRDEVDSVRFVRHMDIETSISPNKTSKVENASPSQEAMEYNQEDTRIRPAPILLSQLQDESVDDERKRKRREMEEKKRRIAEKQNRASLRRSKTEDEMRQPDATSRAQDQVLPEELKEKRRSLLLMWESFSEGQGPDSPENAEQRKARDLEEASRSRDEINVSIVSPTVQSLPESEPDGQRLANIVDYRTMDVEEESEDSRGPLVELDEHHRLNDEEIRWESSGKFQPGKLQSNFYAMQSDEPSDIEFSVKTPTRTERKTVYNGEPEVDNSSYETVQYTMSAPVEEDQSVEMESSETETAPKPLWDESDGQGALDASDEEVDDRKPHVDVDEVHYLSQEEVKWDKWTGQGQPGKLKLSLFQGLQKDERAPEGPKKVKKGDTSRYEVLKKMQKTESKQKILVPTSLDVQVSEKESVVIEDDDRPYVNKLDRSVLQERDVEAERRRLDDERRRREREEIEREREAERRRNEREKEPDIRHEDFIDDEYDAKVRSQNVGKINRGMFEQFQRNGEAQPETRVRKSEEEPSMVTDRIVFTERVEVQSVPNVEAAPDNYSAPDVDGTELDENIYERRIRDKAVGKLSIDDSIFSRSNDEEPPRVVREKRVIHRQEVKVQDIPGVDDEVKVNGDEVRTRSVKKLDKTRFSFASVGSDDVGLTPKGSPQKERHQPSKVEDDRKAQREQEQRDWEERFREEREQIEQMKRAQDEACDMNIANNNVIVDNTNVDEIRHVGRLDHGIFSKFQQDKIQEEIPVRRHKTSVDDVPFQREDEIVVQQPATEVQSTPEYDYNTDEYEVKRLSVGRLKLDDWMIQAREEDERKAEEKRKEKELERIRAEKEEMELLKREQRSEEFESDVFPDERESDRPRVVKKLSQQSKAHFEVEEPKRVSPIPRRRMSPTFKEEKRQERKLARKESRTKMYGEDEGFIIEENTTTVVESQPEELEYEEPKKQVGKLKLEMYVRSEEDEVEARKKILEQERERQEYEEIQKLREEEARRKGNLPSDEEDYPAAEKVYSVNKLDLSHFKQFQKKPVVEMAPPRKSSVKHTKETSPKEAQASREEILVSVETRQDVQSAPPENNVIEREREEALSYDERIKSEVNRLDVNKIIWQRQGEERESQKRARLLEEQRLREERAEMERAREELKARARIETPKESDTLFYEPADEVNTPVTEKPQNVGRLNLNQFSKFRQESTAQPPSPQRPQSRSTEKQPPSQQVTESIVFVEAEHEVESAPEDISFIEKEREQGLSYDKRVKSEVRRLDVDRISQQRRDEERERQRRLKLIEEERLRAEREEIERAKQELKGTRVSDSREYEEEINVQSFEKPTNVGKLDLAQFSKFRKEPEETTPPVRRSSRDSKKESPQRDVSRTKDIVFAESKNEVESAPPQDLEIDYIERERGESLSYDERIKTEVKPLDVTRIIQQRQDEQRESQRRARMLEEQRIRAEREEMERARHEMEESLKRTESENKDAYLTDEHRRILEEREQTTPEKSQNVNKLDLSQFSKFQKSTVEEPVPRRSSVKSTRHETPPKEVRPATGEIITMEIATDVQSAPTSRELDEIERERKEALSYDEKIKTEVKPLNVQMIIQQRQEEERERQRRARMLEEQRLREEKEEMERAREELKRGKARKSASSVQQVVTETRPSVQEERKSRSSSSEIIQSSAVQEVQSEAPYELDSSPPERETKSVGRLNLTRYSQSFDEDRAERERRKVELERQRALQEREEMEKLRLEQQSSRGQVSYDTRTTDQGHEGVNGQEVTLRNAEEQRRGDVSQEPELLPDEEKPVPRRLDLSKFSAFQQGGPVLRRSKGERQTRPLSTSGADLTTWQDDSVIQRREKPDNRRQRPKSIAGSTFQTAYTNGDSKVYTIN